jgi:hypothetical protein
MGARKSHGHILKYIEMAIEIYIYIIDHHFDHHFP